ncbi:MAG: glutamine synthetase [Rubellimicrobium sp.]|nr:glutamine synthetase [Rubellimicrobium sp.]
MPGNLTLDELKAAVAAGEIDTVITAIVDMQGRLMGKRFHARFFLDHNVTETHGCEYLLATDLEMTTVPGYAAASWQTGYGDYVHKPDFSTLRRIPWQEKAAMVLCDVLDHHGEPVPHSPRAVLRRQIARAEAMGLAPMMATELEFFLFRDSYTDLWDSGYRELVPNARYNIDYAITGSLRDEPVMRDLRNGLYGAGIPVECSKGEADAGQEEINILYSDALDNADNHVIVKAAVKEIAQLHDRAATFMAKYRHGKAGSSSHVHQSLFGRDGKNAFYDKDAEHGMSKLMRSYVAGLLDHAQETTIFLAPHVNSYKRFCVGLFAPTRAVWSTDNRTAAFRVCGAGTKAVRVENRIGGSDLNPYLAQATQLAAGLDGIERGLELGPEIGGDVYAAKDAPEVPKTLRDAADLLEGSTFLRKALGDGVVDHYVHNARWEVEQFDYHVTDWEVQRGFERA